MKEKARDSKVRCLLTQDPERGLLIKRPPFSVQLVDQNRTNDRQYLYVCFLKTPVVSCKILLANPHPFVRIEANQFTN